MSKKNIIPIFVPHEGCPNDCVFCNQRKITGISTSITEEDIKNTIETYSTYFKNNNKIEIALYGGSFTAIDMDSQEWILKAINKYVSLEKFDSIRLSTRPDAIDEERLNLLSKYNVKTIELGVQSLDRDVLRMSKRGHSVSSVYESAELIRSFGFNLGLQQMLGLYGDDLDKSLFTAREFVKIGPKFVRIYPTLVIKDTELETLYNLGAYNPLSVEEAVEWVSQIMPIYTKNNIEVIRVGLQPTDNIQLGKDVVAGPFHPAIRQLVESKLIVQQILEVLKEESPKKIKIFASGRNISLIAGNKGTGKKYLVDKLHLDSIEMKIDQKLEDEIKIYFANRVIYIKAGE
ncbi:Radical SAM superfamily protein [Peptoniphilus asaccharolyticus DSM 20463]|uniref:Radical SAM superfamily protein n=1 Tax=Peptoniphilus asaccharolyticus DSM 20463 TaxID=573058 RepID=A0A1W1UT61_PEPAS|nr:radical SAM protein [Peptoniphilus asaccharolyticus]MBL7575157.1 radical SAM protein [Peptoniphilus asaccharolyticus]SMB84315.1 Radical SAM superfamily protein [Peptoniphilus asaccharolyticus DSM 20463]